MRRQVSQSTLSRKQHKWLKADWPPGNVYMHYGHITLILVYKIEDREIYLRLFMTASPLF